MLLSPCPPDCSWGLVVVLQELPCLWDPLGTTADFIQGSRSSLALDRSALKDGWCESGLGTGFWIPILAQSIPTCTLLLLPSPLVWPFLESTSSRGRYWLHLFWLVECGGSWSWFCWCPLSTFWGVILGLGAHWSSFPETAPSVQAGQMWIDNWRPPSPMVLVVRPQPSTV